MNRVYIGIFGSGLGHASRMMAISETLAGEGCSVQYSSSAEAAEYIRRQGGSCNEIPLVDVVFTESGSFSATETMKVTPWLFVKLMKQAGLEARNIMRFRPDAVLSDSVVSTVMASKLLGVKCVTVLNQLRLVSSPKTPPLAGKLLTNGSITVGNELWELSDRILLPDLPPPYTISECNLWGAGSASTRAEYIGFLTPPRANHLAPETARLLQTGKKVVFWQVSGPARTRASLLPRVKKVAAAIKDDCLSVISAGNPLGSTEPAPVDGGYIFDWCPSKDAMIDLCDVFVSRAGHVTISDLILREKPSVLVPIPGQSEQLGNASKAERMGIAVDIQEPDLTEARFREALTKLGSDETKKKLKNLSEYARGFDAKRSILQALQN